MTTFDTEFPLAFVSDTGNQTTLKQNMKREGERERETERDKIII